MKKFVRPPAWLKDITGLDSIFKNYKPVSENKDLWIEEDNDDKDEDYMEVGEQYIDKRKLKEVFS